MANEDGDLSKHASTDAPSASFGKEEPSFRLGTEHFEADILPSLSAADTLVLVVLLGTDGSRPVDAASKTVGSLEDAAQTENRILATAAAKGVQLASIIISAGDGTSPAKGVAEAGISSVDIGIQVRVQLPSLRLSRSTDSCGDGGTDASASPPLLGELAAKLCLNAVSTGAHVMKGCVYHNRMINLNVSNFKLFERSVAVIESIAGVPEVEACDCLLCAIYSDIKAANAKAGSAQGDDVYAILRRARSLPVPASIPEHVVAASGQKKLVPLALLLAMMRRGDASDLDSDAGLAEMVKLVAKARGELLREPVLRLLLATAMDEKRVAP